VRLYLDPKRYEDARIIITGMLAGEPDSSELNHLAGIAYYGLEDNEAAVRHFKKVQPESRFYDDAVVHVSFLLHEAGKTDEAINYLLSALEKDPDNAEFCYYLGTMYEESESYDQALTYLQKAIASDPENPKYYFRLGVVQDKGGDKTGSIASMRKVIELDPQHANALNYLGYTYADLGQNLDEAERLIKEAMKYKPDDGYITDSLGWVYYKRGQYEQALTYLKKAVALVPDDPVMLEHLGDIYLKLKDVDNALKYYRMALTKKDGDKQALEQKIQQLTNSAN
jgi:tetratricopeptide (TPR) repeat protein